MKRFLKCQNCGHEAWVPRKPERHGGGWELRCPDCKTILLVVRRPERDFHYELLDFAQHHLREGETRAAVVEVFGALDVFARRWARAALRASGTPEVLVRRLTKRASTHRLLELVNELYPQKLFGTPPSVVFDLRNAVIHEGKVPTQVEAERAEKEVRLWMQYSLGKGRPEFDIPDRPEENP